MAALISTTSFVPSNCIKPSRATTPKTSGALFTDVTDTDLLCTALSSVPSFTEKSMVRGWVLGAGLELLYVIERRAV